MRKIMMMAGAAMLLAAPAFASPTPTETMTGGSSSSVSSANPYAYYYYGGPSESAFAGSSSNVGIQNSNFTSYNHDVTTTNSVQAPVEEPGVSASVNDVSATDTTTTGTAALESGGTSSLGGEYGGAVFQASGYEYGSASANPNAGFGGYNGFGDH